MEKYSVDIVIPVYYGNLEELEQSVKKQVEFYKENLKDFKWKIVISINGKDADKIIEKSKELTEKYEGVTYLYNPMPGKGAGVMNAWNKSEADIRAYMDVDLATDLKDFKNLIEQVVLGYDISTGSRYHPFSKVNRKLIRVITSGFYHTFVTRLFLGAKYHDAQCGFKAVNKKIVDEVLPIIKDHNWFFESEMMYLAQKKGFKIKEIPIVWKETWKSGIHSLRKIVVEFLKKSIELRFRKL